MAITAGLVGGVRMMYFSHGGAVFIPLWNAMWMDTVFWCWPLVSGDFEIISETVHSKQNLFVYENGHIDVWWTLS